LTKVAEERLPKGYIQVTGFVNRTVKRGWVLRKHYRVERMRCGRCHLAFIGMTSERCQCKVR